MSVVGDNSLDPGPERRPLPRCPSQGSPSAPTSFGSGPGFCCETLHCPITEKRHTQNSPKGCSPVVRPDLVPHLLEVLLDSVLRPLACLRHKAVSETLNR
jgi:hypothetical protein